jgi:hypothetical protein
MKVSKRIPGPLMVLLLGVLHVGVLHVQAQENGQSPPFPPKYRLELVHLLDTDSAEYIFVVGNIGFKSVTSLEKFLSTLPPGSILEWAPGCLRSGSEPLLSSVQEMEDFKAFCAASNINFVLVPSG